MFMMTIEQIEKKLNQQEILLQAIYKNSEKVRKYILWGRVMSAVYIVLIVAPFIIAAMYLPSFIKNAIGPYRELLGTVGSSAGPLGKEKKVEESLGGLRNLQNVLDDFGVRVEQEQRY